MTIMPPFPEISTKQMQISINQCGHIVQTASAWSLMDDEKRRMSNKNPVARYRDATQCCSHLTVTWNVSQYNKSTVVVNQNKSNVIMKDFLIHAQSNTECPDTDFHKDLVHLHLKHEFLLMHTTKTHNTR
jgi:hypothetical protein